MTVEAFETRQKRLVEEWEQEASSPETEDEVGHAILDLFLKSERLRRGVEAPSPEQTVVDCETVEKLGDARSLGPEFSFAEAAFRRLVDDPASAIKYIEQSKAMCWQCIMVNFFTKIGRTNRILVVHIHILQ
jgi:hypothetical protein